MTLDLVALAKSCGVVPQRTADPLVARDLMMLHGASVLTGLDGSIEDARTLAPSILGDALVADAHPIEVTDGGGVDRRRTADAARRMLPLHTDGFAYGALAPDVFFLLCATPSKDDGLSFLVDQEQLLNDLALTPEGAAIATFVRTKDVDQSEPGGVPAIGPIALPLTSGINAIRRSLDVRPCDDDPDPATTARMLTLWQGLLDAVGAMCVRFAVGKGEALAIDNTRLAHGRDAYTTPGRMLWRCWAWTNRSGGVPNGELWSDTRMVLSIEH